MIYIEDAMRPTEDIERTRDEPDWHIATRWLTLRNARGHRPPGFLTSGVTDRLHIDGAYDDHPGPSQSVSGVMFEGAVVGIPRERADLDHSDRAGPFAGGTSTRTVSERRIPRV